LAAGIVAQHAGGVHADEVHAEGDVMRPKLDALAGGFERAASAQLGLEVATQDRHVGHVAGGGKTGGQGQQRAGTAFGGDAVHGWFARDLQRSTAAEAGHGLIGHAVAEKNDGFDGWHKEPVWLVSAERRPAGPAAPPYPTAIYADGARRGAAAEGAASIKHNHTFGSTPSTPTCAAVTCAARFGY
jgi:hypothetical protein